MNNEEFSPDGLVSAPPLAGGNYTYSQSPGRLVAKVFEACDDLPMYAVIRQLRKHHTNDQIAEGFKFYVESK